MYSQLQKWFSENKTDVLTEMIPEYTLEGEYIFNAENARKQLELLRAWKDNSQ